MKFNIKVAGVKAECVEVGEIEIEQEFSSEELLTQVQVIREVIDIIKTETRPIIQLFAELERWIKTQRS